MTATTAPQRIRTTGGRLLRGVLRADAASCALTGVAAIALSTRLPTLMGAGAPALYVGLGAALLAYAGWLLWIAAPEQISRRNVWINLALTLLWIVDSVALLVSGWQPLTTAGFWVIAGLADVAAVLGVLQLVALRRGR